MSKLTRVQIYEKVVESLRGSLQTINGIANNTGIRWETVEITVKSLYDAGFLDKQGDKYQLVDDKALQNDTYLGIPLTDDKKKVICEIANRIREKKPTYPKTYLQKAVIEVLKKANLKEIPFGWYLYGECCALKLDNPVLSHYTITAVYDAQIDEVIQEFEPFDNVKKLLDHLYNKSDNTLYVAKLDAINILEKEFTEESLKELDNKFKRVMWKQNKEDSLISDLFIIFYSIFSQIRKLKLEEIEALRSIISNAFDSVWELIGTHEYYQSLKDFYTFDIKPYYTYRVKALIQVADERLDLLEENCPPLKLNPALDKFKGSLEGQSQ